MTPHGSPQEALEAIDRMLWLAAPTLAPMRPVSDEVARPVVELTIHGTLGFKRHELDLDAVESLILSHCDPLLPRVKYDAIPAEYAVAPGAAPGMDRHELERQVLRDLVSRDSRYQARADEVGRTLVALKQQAIAGTPAPEIARYVSETLGTLY